MPFNYLIEPPCSSAKKVIDEATNEVIGYLPEGCPAVLVNDDNTVLCSNGHKYNTDTDKDYNAPFVGNLTNRFNTIDFNIGQTVYVEDVLGSLRKIFDFNTVQLFLSWNDELINELKDKQESILTLAATSSPFKSDIGLASA